MAYRNTYANNYQSINSNPYLTQNDVRLGDIFTRAFGGGYDEAQQNKRTKLSEAVRLQGQQAQTGIGWGALGLAAYPSIEQHLSSLADIAQQHGDIKAQNAYLNQASQMREAQMNLLGRGVYGNQFSYPTFGSYTPPQRKQGAFLRPDQQYTTPQYNAPSLQDYQKIIQGLWTGTPDNGGGY